MRWPSGIRLLEAVFELVAGAAQQLGKDMLSSGCPVIAGHCASSRRLATLAAGGRIEFVTGARACLVVEDEGLRELLVHPGRHLPVVADQPIVLVTCASIWRTPS
jgi:hypothetical protein